MNTVLLILVLNISNILCFFLGAKMCQTVNNNKELKIKNPISIIKNNIEKKEEDQKSKIEEERLNTMLDNIENYNGTELGQKKLQ